MQTRLTIERGLHALVAVALALAYALSFAALIFSGDLRAGLGYGVFSALAAVAVGGLVIAFFSEFPIAMAGPDNNPTAVLILVASALAVVAPAKRVPTMLTIIALATLVTGLVLIVLGSTRTSRVIRFIPEPMVGGFNAASGVLVLLGSLRVLTGHPLGLAAARGLFEEPVPAQFGFAVALAILLVLLSRRFGAVAIPMTFLAAIVAALAAIPILHLSLVQLRGAGWFFSMPATAAPFYGWSVHAPIDLHATLTSVPAMFVIAIVSAATLLFNETGLELLTGKDVDLDRELRVTGWANVAASLLGGMVAYVSFARTSMNHALGVRDRSIGVVVAVVAIAAMIVGPWRLIEFLPVFAPAALLMALGGGVAYRWLIQKRGARSTGDHLTLWAIVIVIVWLGFIPGIIVGLAIGCITFAVRYGRVDAVQHRWSGAVIRSSLQRSQRESEVLALHGDRIRIFRLRGFVFFGTADRLYRELLECARASDGAVWIVADFGGVTGIDSSAVAAFIKLARNVDADRVRFMVCSMGPQVALRWNASFESHVGPPDFADLDLALEFCEAQLLHIFGAHLEEAAGLESWLTTRYGSSLAKLIGDRVERIELSTGDVLCAQGESSDRMFFVHSGRLAVLIDDCRIRIRSLGTQTTLGEMGLYRNMPRDATVVAETATVVYALGREGLHGIETADPTAAMAFHAAIVRLLADRIDHQNEVIASMTA
ncbi:MAG TPA: SulP family inorganic anion transporter [Candidatus Baltobacteraceae bacterium]|nr:SulP family inorganic anion transporter [Candidatus Baltobacteraceae bacterium]